MHDNTPFSPMDQNPGSILAITLIPDDGIESRRNDDDQEVTPVALACQHFPFTHLAPYFEYQSCPCCSTEFGDHCFVAHVYKAVRGASLSSIDLEWGRALARNAETDR